MRQPFRRILELGTPLLLIHELWDARPPVIVIVTGGIGAAMIIAAALGEVGVRLYVRWTARRSAAATDAFGSNRD
jgi:hypothetical protein